MVVAYPDEPLKNSIGQLPVVSREDPRRLVGYLSRTRLVEARLRKMHEEEFREWRWNVAGMTK